MGLEIFYVSNTNPNHAFGGGGCLCSPSGSYEGPYVVFNGTDTENTHSPFPVICAGCLRRAAEALSEEQDG